MVVVVVVVVAAAALVVVVLDLCLDNWNRVLKNHARTTGDQATIASYALWAAMVAQVFGCLARTSTSVPT